jgi:hypothetical protein
MATFRGMADDDFFGGESSSSEEDYLQSTSSLAAAGRRVGAVDSMMRAEVASRDTKYRSIGYLEAFEAHSEDRLQDGFDAGFVSAVERGRGVGVAFGRLVGKEALLQAKVKVKAKAKKEYSGGEDENNNDNYSESAATANAAAARLKEGGEKVRKFLEEAASNQGKHYKSSGDDNVLVAATAIQEELKRNSNAAAVL